MLLMTKYSNEVSFLDLVTILTTLNNLKCRRFLGHPLYLGSGAGLDWVEMFANSPAELISRNFAIFEYSRNSKIYQV